MRAAQDAAFIANILLWFALDFRLLSSAVLAGALSAACVVCLHLPSRRFRSPVLGMLAGFLARLAAGLISNELEKTTRIKTLIPGCFHCKSKRRSS